VNMIVVLFAGGITRDADPPPPVPVYVVVMLR